MTIQVRPYIRGQVIAEAGCYSPVPMELSHGPSLCTAPSISSSGLRRIFNESPAHYWAHSPYNEHAVEEKEKAEFVLGRAAHHLFLGEGKFSESYILRPEEIGGKPWHGLRGDCKDWLADAAERRLTVLTPEQGQSIEGMAESLAAHPLVRAGLLSGLVEHTITWRDRETGIWLKSRPDAIPNDSGDFIDLKTTTAVDDDSLEKAIGDFAYPMQGALVSLAAEVLGIPFNTFTLVFVEKKRPNCVRVIALKPGDLDRAKRQIQASLRSFAHGMETMQWPGPGGAQTDAVYLSLKPWTMKRIDERLEEMAREEAA